MEHLDKGRLLETGFLDWADCGKLVIKIGQIAGTFKCERCLKTRPLREETLPEIELFNKKK